MNSLFVLSFFCTILSTFAQSAQRPSGYQNIRMNPMIANMGRVTDPRKDETFQVSSNVIQVDSKRKGERQKRAASVYHSLPMPFINYPFPFVNSYTTRYFPYSYAGVGMDNVLGNGGIGYGSPAYGGLGYAYGYGGWF